MSMFRRVLPHPYLSLFIILLWMSLASALTAGQFLLAVFFAIVVPWLTQAFWVDQPRIVRPIAALGLFGIFLYDVVVANLEVARRVLGPIHALKPAWVEVPLDIDDAFIATVLGSIITLTPGTLTCTVDVPNSRLLVHFLHVEDQQASVADIKSRYEARLKRIFAC